MNIMLFSRILAKTGVGNHINLLFDALQKQGHNVIVVSGTKDIALNNDKVKFIKIDTVSRSPGKVIKSIFHLRKIIKDHAIEIVHCHHRVASIYVHLYNIVFNIPYVYSLHLANIPHDFFHRMLTFTGEYAIGVSTEVSKFLVEKLRVVPDKVVTILNGVDETKLQCLSEQEKNSIKSEWNIPRSNFVIVLHSRIDKVKNHLLVVEAINKLTDEEKRRVSVVCSGEKTGAYYYEVIELIRRYNLESVFSFVGWVDARKILGIADFLFLPSMNEGFGLNVAEAFLMKVPVARTKTAGYEDLKYCLPISETNAMDMVDIIRDVLNKGMDEYQIRIQKAYEFAKETLTAEKMAQNTLKIYEKVYSKHERTSHM